MKIFLDTAHVKTIKKWSSSGILDGVTTNPSHLSKEGGNPQKVIQEICSLLPHGEISVEITEKEPKAVYTQAKKLAALGENILVKVPCHLDYYPIIHKLVSEKVKLNITLVFSLIQGLMMSKLGVEYISPFVGRLNDIEVDGSALLFELRHMQLEYGFSTNILAASIRTVRDFHTALDAGVDAITLPVDILEKATQHILTEKGIALFDADWKTLGIKQFP